MAFKHIKELRQAKSQIKKSAAQQQNSLFMESAKFYFYVLTVLFAFFGYTITHRELQEMFMLHPALFTIPFSFISIAVILMVLLVANMAKASLLKGGDKINSDFIIYFVEKPLNFLLRFEWIILFLVGSFLIAYSIFYLIAR